MLKPRPQVIAHSICRAVRARGAMLPGERHKLVALLPALSGMVWVLAHLALQHVPLVVG